MGDEDQGYHAKDQQGGFGYVAGSDALNQAGGKKHTDVGLASLTAGDFFNQDGTPKTVEELVTLLQPHKPGYSREGLINQINDMMPKLRGIDQKEAKFLSRQKDIQGKERGLAMDQATDAYGLTSRSAQRGLQSSLGQAQQQASSLGGAMRNAYGGSSMGMRGAMAGQESLAKGVESTYGSYQDKMTGAQQALGYAERQYGEGGIREQGADLAYDKGIYGLQKDRTSEFEGDIANFLQGFRNGGKVKTFSEVLARIPDAKGS